MKKSLIFWLAAVTCAAWILVGCEQEPETKTNTVTNGAAADIPSLQLLLDEPGVNPVYYKGVVALTGDQLVVPPGKTLVAADGVTVDATSVFAVAGTLSLGAGKGITVSGAGIVVGNQGVLDSVTGVSAVTGKLAASVATAFTGDNASETVALVLTASGTDLTTANVPTGKTLYVANTLALAAAPTLTSTGSIIVLGTVNVVDALGDIFAATPTDTKIDISGATLTNTVAATVTLPATAAVKAINAAAGKLTVAGAGTSLTVGSLTGNLALPTSAGTVTIKGGAGNVEGAALTTTGAVTLNNTGTAAFSGNVSLGGDLTVTSAATIGGTLTGPGSSATITFNGETASIGSYTTKATGSADTFAGSAALTIATLTDTSDGASKVTFNGTGLAKIMNNFAVATGGLTIAGTGFVDVENETGPTVATVGLSIANTGGVHFDKLVVGSSSNTVTLTKAVFSAGSAAAPILLTTASGDGFTLGTGDVLALADEGTIAVAASGKITIGAHGEISGVGTWTADAGTDEYVAITSLADVAFIGASKRDASTAETAGTLAATDGTAGVIKVAAQKTLVLGAKTTINVGGTSSKVGAIVLANHNSTPGKLVFDGTGAQITTGNSGGSSLSGADGVFADSDSTTQDVVPVSAFSNSDYVTITGGEGSLTSIVFGGGEAYITGPKASGGSAATISAVTDCTS